MTINGKVVKKNCDEVNLNYNSDEYNPRDGELIEAVDELAAFVEAYLSCKHGITTSLTPSLVAKSTKN